MNTAVNNSLPIHIFKGVDSLTYEKIEKSILESSSLFQNYKWSNECVQRGIFIDLSYVRWVNFGAANQLTLFIEGALKNNINVYIALPLKRLTQKEENSKSNKIHLYKNLRNKRIKANDFLKFIQFDIAIKCSHVRTDSYVYITEDFEYNTEGLQKDYFYYVFNNLKYTTSISTPDFSKFNYQYAFPLMWVDCEKGFDSNNFENNLEKILGENEKGLNKIDVKSLKNVIVSELIKNVKEHSGDLTTHALFSAGLFTTKSIAKEKEDQTVIFTNELEYNYTKWLIDNSIESFIEIYFGDSGEGLFRKDFIDAYNKFHSKSLTGLYSNEKIDLIKWSFDKWSTRKKENIRGTKGLYRIGRIVNKYNGVITIRSNDICGGFQKGGFSNLVWIDNSNVKNYNQIGTFIQIKLCPFKEIVKFNFSFEKTKNDKKWQTHKFEFTDYSTSKFKEWLLEKVKRDINLLLILNFHEQCLREPEPIKILLQESFKQISDYRHPNGIVVYIADDFGDTFIQEIAKSTNEIILKENQEPDSQEHVNQESISPSFERIYDPVLILGKQNEMFWYGGNQHIINILNYIYQSQRQFEKIDTILYYNELSIDERNKILLHFQNDDSLIVISKDIIEFNFTNIPDFFNRKITEIICSKNESKNICTPRLKIVDRWFDLNTILESNEVGYALAMNLMLLKNEYTKIQALTSKTKILIDNKHLNGLALAFAGLNKIKQSSVFCISEDIDTSIPSRTQLFDNNDQVVIITSFISSSETIRRMVKYVLRDIAKPICILCLANYRNYKINRLETWSHSIPILSIYSKYQNDVSASKVEYTMQYLQKLSEDLNKSELFISPSGHIENEIVDNNFLNGYLKSHFIETRALYYSHIGKYNSRHFTFYINKERLLESRSVIWDEILNRIQSWIRGNNIASFTLIQPEIIKGSHTALNNCIQYLRKEIKGINVVNWNLDYPSIISGKDIAYLDFGSITGNSINKVLTYIENANNVLVCIIFSQFQNGEFDFYNRIKQIEVKNNQEQKSKQIAINFFDEDSKQDNIFIKATKSRADIDIQHIYNLPIKFYNSTTCPICEHEKSLNHFKGEEGYNVRFAVDRAEKLQIRNREDLTSIPTDFYSSDKTINQHEISSVLIMQMYELSVLLDHALNITKYRLRVYDFIFDSYNNFNEYKSEHNSPLYAILYLISLEVNWLQREPLVYRELRFMLSEIALKISLIKIEELAVLFSSSADKAIVKNLAIRYKFAAITVLRSTNKYNFCKNIANILIAAKNGERYSDNLFQNVLYHINSIHQNSYNKSIEYFNNIGDELDKIKDINGLSIEQKSAISSTITKNEIVKEKLNLSEGELKSPLKIIMQLKDKIDSEYYEIEGHPIPPKYFENLEFRTLGVDGDAWSDFKKQRTDSLYFEEFEEKKYMLLDKWLYVKDYITVIQERYLKNLESSVLKSELFNNSRFVWARMPETIKRFSELIQLISSDILNLIPCFEEYHSLYDFMNEAVIQYEKQNDPNTSDCHLLKALKYFPSDLNAIIVDVFHKHSFKELCLPSQDKYPVFYPKIQLNEALAHIKNNVKSKLNVGKSLNDVTVNIDIVEEPPFFKLTIKNDFTNECARKNDKGGLSSFSNDLGLYGGKLETYFIKDEFYVEINMLKYERI